MSHLETLEGANQLSCKAIGQKKKRKGNHQLRQEISFSVHLGTIYLVFFVKNTVDKR